MKSTLRSQLCIFDCDAGSVRVLLDHAGHIEAPNWHKDGYLVVNGGGQLFKVPLDAPALQLIDTGFAQACNNDHGISPDGRRLVISDSSLTVQSCIYTLPITGGTPQRVTEHTPSYWHGWSPDGVTLAYAAKRGVAYGLFTCAASGGAETCVIDSFEHIDGPDYSPDGAWIWFNGERDGQVDLWRIRPNGTDLTQMTDDAAVNWFPHPSPDGAQVLYLAYPAGTQGHPAGLDVALRMMPAGGGASRELVTLWGGQGTINVPCWAPDSRQFAFMRYSKAE
ncbi:WD40-like Beta Propeller Repeat [Yoonia tamlensis]|uniref:WD40-like Beta Propeller Repeat n=1 Tax=Yoonia tamlensis TaxID=390270 RepID=A0A1I6GWE2_9RHOB|nr:PD40 domain-containing protein [Yoonia tamlensis]SFR46367.1 WD40-like Beta Propeller Repeat [Yoonia tamlensis]